MEEKPVYSFNAPQFVDFCKNDEPSFDDDADIFFDVDHEKVSKINISSKKPSNSNEEYFSPVLEYHDSGVSDTTGKFEDCYEHSRTKLKPRRSMSVGNLILFSEEENQDTRQTELHELSEHRNLSEKEAHKEQNAIGLKAHGSLERKYQERQRNTNRDRFSKLAEPKRYCSVENLKQDNTGGNYVSMAEAIYHIEHRTPIRFRSKPNLAQLPFQPLTRTIPESPALQTKARTRPGPQVLSHDERELLEFQNLQKCKIKAHPVNKKVLQGPMKALPPVEKKPPTVPKPFKLGVGVPPKRVVTSPKKVVRKDSTTLAEKPRKPLEIWRKEPTKPVTPTFMKNYKPPSHRKLSLDQSKETKPQEEKPRITKPEPFSFDPRDKLVQQKREKLLKKMLDEEKRARVFHARPVPKYVYKDGDSVKTNTSLKNHGSVKNSSSVSVESKSSLVKYPSTSSIASSQGSAHSSENLYPQFKAQPPTVLYKEPFVPVKGIKPPTQVVPFQLRSDIRYHKREEFERERRSKEEEIEHMKKIAEEDRLKEEQQEIARLRKQTVHKAQPIKKYKEVIIEPSGRVTVPISPKFLAERGRVVNNKENIPDNV